MYELTPGTVTVSNEISMIAILAFASLLPFLIAAGSCFIKFSIVFSLVRNAIGLQEVPSNMTLQGVALILTFFVMSPVITQVDQYVTENNVSFKDAASVKRLVNEGLGDYRSYLKKYSDPELVQFFSKLQARQALDTGEGSVFEEADPDDPSVLTLLPAYALSEIKSAFRIGFYIYLPFIVIDLLVSNILLALGMMMMSPVTVALPIKLVLFVAIDGWSRLSQGLIGQYMEIGNSQS